MKTISKHSLIILAGGFGTRLQSVSSGVPKTLIPIGDSVYLDLLLEKVFAYAISHIYLSLHYKSELFQDYVNNSNYKNMLTCVIEPAPLGTGGAVNYVIETSNISSLFFVINGDSISDINLDHMFEQFYNRNLKGMLGISDVLETSRYGRVIEKDDIVLSFEEKGVSGRGCISNGYYIFKKEAFDDFTGTFSLETDLFPKLLKNKELGIFKVFDDNFIDMGVPEDYDKLCKMFQMLN